MTKIKAIILLIFSFGSAYGQTLPPKQAYPLDVKQIHSGHSLTDPLFGPWPGQYVELISELRSTWAGDEIVKATIPGSGMFWRWDHENDLSPSARYNIDDFELLVITEAVPLTQITNSNEHLSLYVNNAWNNGNNGNGAATLLWTTWTNIDDSDGPWRQTLDDYESLWEEMQDYANANRPNGSTPVYLIPGHRMMARIYDDIQLNLVPGITNINQLFSDNIHPNSLGAYAITMIHYACVYNQSPVGLPNDLMANPPSGFQTPSPELSAYLQNIIWEIVTNYSRTGITDTSLSISETEAILNDTSIYPNPTKDIIYIKNEDLNNNLEKTIYDIKGNILYNGSDNKINIGHFSSGIYILKIGNRNIKLVKH
ncbi:T9SS type A sorting domain-containing protein [Flavivirga algicola]|uniref:T9SS type A sorting domain-containing protein n=1 Tax=Flavivirga algicola TaxID=2729136 RepID=A0ABX1RUP7_9FLAO|nr:T9SS type A sorting domain-containing protein [Flavivirga algicola]NMH86901.1 T9SS type A sorting domain-containing protein [Flavivirga algicola]